MIFCCAKVGIRLAAPARRKPACLSSPVIRAGCEFLNSGSHRSTAENHSETTRIQHVSAESICFRTFQSPTPNHCETTRIQHVSAESICFRTFPHAMTPADKRPSCGRALVAAFAVCEKGDRRPHVSKLPAAFSPLFHAWLIASHRKRDAPMPHRSVS